LIVGLCGAIGVGALVSAMAPRHFEVTARLATTDPTGDPDILERRLATQAALAGSPLVIERVLSHPEQAHWIRPLAHETAAEVLGRSVTITTQSATGQVWITARGARPDAALGLAEAYVAAYFDQLREWSRGDERTNPVAKVIEEQEARRGQLRSRLEELAREGGSSVPLLEEKSRAALEEYRGLLQKLVSVRLARVEAAAEARTVDRELLGRPGAERADTPEIAELRRRIETAERKSRSGSETRRLRARLEQLEAGAGHVRSDSDQGHGFGSGGSRDGSAELARLQRDQSTLEARVQELEEEARALGGHALEVEFAREDLATTQKTLAGLQEGEAGMAARGFGKELKPIAALDAGSVRASPQPRTWGLLAGSGWFLCIFGITFLAEWRAGIVTIPEDLPSGLRRDVLGVVPPPPGASRGRPEATRARIAEFVQSLDHLRELIRAGGESRVVLITSAMVGEGKTTLAAQLAARCAQAGISTALVDADLRRPSLGAVLEVDPTHPGLIDVLCGTASAEEALVPVIEAGGFYVLAAGTEGMDPTRLLHAERLGQLIDQLRGSFELVIVDAPPVLPVADTLTLGRWVDVAILTVRSDTSRLAWIEQARAKLEAVDVPILGVVVQGCRARLGAYAHYAAASTV
jgi:capsular exopolysaccharide synthesis family protein